MGFRDTLLGIGLGRRRYGGYQPAGQRIGMGLSRIGAGLKENKFSQALAAAAQSGDMITPQQMIEISEQYNIPFPDVMKRVNVFNKSVQIEKQKQQLHALGQMYMKLTPEEKSALDTTTFMKMAQKTGVEDVETLGIFKDAIMKLKDKEKIVTGAGPVRSIQGNKVTVLDEGLENEKSYGSLILQTYGDRKVLLQKDSTGKQTKVESWSTKPLSGEQNKQRQRQMESDIIGLKKKKVDLQARVDIVSDVTQPEIDQAIRETQKMIDVMKKEYKNLYPKDIGRIGEIIGTERKIVRKGKDSQGRKVVEYDDGSIEYAD